MIGKALAHYRVVGPLGAGGMGEVYRALDTKLGRDVALKVLPEAFARDPERLARFEREARLLASLSHPNIAAIHGLEQAGDVHFLVLELIEGQTLAERLAGGPLPVEEAVGLCRQVAEALEAAHEKGVIHRDLKPANVKVTSAGKVKVLDFGLAKAFAGEEAADLSRSPTVTEAATRAGVLLGTAAYMSPEQARGKPVDKRTDIWAFGCVLYECLTGKQAFPGETVSDAVAGILKSEPDWARLPAETPPGLRALLPRCLQKDPARRLHDIADARLEIEEALARPTAAAPSAIPATRSPAPWRRLAGFWAIGILTGAVITLAFWHLWHRREPTRTPVRFSITLPADQRLGGGLLRVEVSPDGRNVVYVARSRVTSQLYIRGLDEFGGRPLPGTEGGNSPFFSPNGKWVGFNAGGKLKKVSLEGGSPLVLCDAGFGSGSWGPDDTVIFTPNVTMGLWQVAASGGTPQKLTEPDTSKGELGHWWPQILPGGKSVIFTAYSTPVEKARVAALTLKTGEIRTLVEGAVFGRYVSTGHLLFARGQRLLAVSLDLSRLEVKGPPVVVVEDVAVEPANGNSQLAVSENGTLAYVPASLLNPESVLVWVRRDGQEEVVSESRRAYGPPALSPDGERVAVLVVAENPDLWLYERARGTLTRFTFGEGSEFYPVWTPDGRRLIFASEQPQFDLQWKPIDGSGPEEVLLSTPYDKRPTSVSPDGALLVFSQEHPETRHDIWLLPLKGERKPRPFLQTRFDEGGAAISPDGRWIAYHSDESGQYEIYLQTFPAPGSKQQISTARGSSPRWSRDGRTLFYRSPEGVMAVEIAPGAPLRAGRPRALFPDIYETFPTQAGYDVGPDGRLLMVKTPPEAWPRQINVVLNWFEELKRGVPAAK